MIVKQKRSLLSKMVIAMEIFVPQHYAQPTVQNWAVWILQPNLHQNQICFPWHPTRDQIITTKTNRKQNWAIKTHQPSWATNTREPAQHISMSHSILVHHIVHDNHSLCQHSAHQQLTLWQTLIIYKTRICFTVRLGLQNIVITL